MLRSAIEPAPLISLVTPSLNQGRFLGRAIESVLAQRYPRLQYFVIDGGSRDESVGVLGSYAGRIEWVSEPDRGQAHAINKGLARAGGEILGYLNSDDMLLPGALQRVARHFAEHPDCDLVYGDADYIDEADRVTGRYRTAPYSFERLMQDCMVCQPAAFWRRRIAEKVGPFDETLHYALDYDYWLRIARAGGRIEHLPERLACSRRHPATKTATARAEIHREIWRVCWSNAGYVHPNFFLGYWHHLIHERKNPVSRALRYVPRLYRILGRVHHKWYHFGRHLRQPVATRAGGPGGRN